MFPRFRSAVVRRFFRESPLSSFSCSSLYIYIIHCQVELYISLCNKDVMYKIGGETFLTLTIAVCSVSSKQPMFTIIVSAKIWQCTVDMSPPPSPRSASSFHIILQPSSISNHFNRLSMYFIQRCFICHPSNSIVLEDAGIELRTVAPWP